MEAMMMFLRGIVEQYATLFPAWVIALILIVGSLRIVVKPAMALFKAVTEVTPSKKDDELYVKVEGSKALSILTFALDWLASIKLPAKKPEVKAVEQVK